MRIKQQITVAIQEGIHSDSPVIQKHIRQIIAAILINPRIK